MSNAMTSIITADEGVLGLLFIDDVVKPGSFFY